MSERAALTKTSEKNAKESVSTKPKENLSQTLDSPAEQILHLQQTIGNQAVQRLIESGTLQAKLKIGKSNDKYEQEADRVAERVISMPESKQSLVNGHSSLVQRQAEEEEEPIQTKPLADQITPLVQRQAGPEEQEEAQIKLQRQAEKEEEEPVQTKLLQRQEGEEEEEVQTKLQRKEEDEDIQAKQAPNQAPAVTSNIESGIQSLKGGGQPLPKSTRSYFEPRFGADFSQVRVHTDSHAAETAKSINAKAFTKRKDVVFGAGQYSPTTPTGKQLLAHELTHVVQQMGNSAPPGFNVLSSSPGSMIQRAHASDSRLPKDKTEALAYASAANTEIKKAIQQLRSSSDKKKKNIPDYIKDQRLRVGPLTPRHDSTVGAATIRFFPGYKNYTGSVTRPGIITYYISGSRKHLWVRARGHANIDHMLSAIQIEERVVQVVSNVSHTRASSHKRPNMFEKYRGKFNGLWEIAPYKTQSTVWDPIKDSRGPRSEKARSIFKRIYSEDPAFASAYHNNTGGIKGRVDTYMGPDSLNPLNSPRVQKLRKAFYRYPTPIKASWKYKRFKREIKAAAAPLEMEERDAIANSNEWQRLIAIHCKTQPQRDEIAMIINNQPATSTTTTPPKPPATTTLPPVSSSIAQKFLDGVFIDGPTAPISANNKTESVTLTPKSPTPNPGVTVDSRFTVTPKRRIKGNNVSPTSPWPHGNAMGTPFTLEIYNSGNVTMKALLDLLNEPSGLKPSKPATLSFNINDNRLANLLSKWKPGINYMEYGNFKWYDPASPPVVKYFGGTQLFNVWARLPGFTNPGLTLFVRIQILRGGSGIVPVRIDPFPMNQNSSPTYQTAVSAPSSFPVGGDSLVFKLEILDKNRTTVLSTQNVTMKVQPQATYTKSQATTAAGNDETYLTGTASGQFLHQMKAKGGRYANFADAAQPPNKIIDIIVFTLRHDSANYLVRAHQPATKAAYFKGKNYLPYPDPANTAIYNVGLPAYSLPNQVYLNRTTDVAAGKKRGFSELAKNAMHEGTHAVDPRYLTFNPLVRYKREFRAYWMQGMYGPPQTTICPLKGADCYNTDFDPTLPPPGPKSPRARKIFEHLYSTYSFVKPAYDANKNGFREVVDNYHHPDGINLIFSKRLDKLQKIIRSYTSANFSTVHVNIQRFMGIGAPPSMGALNANEKAEIKNNRAWGELIDYKVRNRTHRATIKSTLGVP